MAHVTVRLQSTVLLHCRLQLCRLIGAKHSSLCTIHISEIVIVMIITITIDAAAAAASQLALLLLRKHFMSVVCLAWSLSKFSCARCLFKNSTGETLLTLSLLTRNFSYQLVLLNRHEFSSSICFVPSSLGLTKHSQAVCDSLSNTSLRKFMP